MSSRLLFLLLAVFSHSLAAGEVRHASVDYQSGVYSVTFDVEVEAAFEEVRKIVTDYENLHKLSDILTRSTLVTPVATEARQRLIVISACILVYCREAELVESVEEVSPNLIVTRTVPGLSDFKSGEIRWHITRLDNNRTRIQFNGMEEPDFWIPPLIGPLLVKRLLYDEAIKVIRNIELLSGNA